MSNETKDSCACGPACTCSPCDCRRETAPAAASREGDRSDARKTGCSCGC